ncbi:MAG: Gfo/Idh/MocA family oxidoreductase [Rhodothermaceae bacterium]
MKNFALTGVAGYIAPRHLKAIADTGNKLIAAVDPHDSVGIIDRYFSDVSYFSEFERFDRHLEKLRRKGEAERMHYLTVCSPNHLHDSHIRLGLRLGADVISEKPLVLNPWNVESLEELEKETGKKVYTILQLRVHPSLIELKKKIKAQKSDKKYNVCLSYITSRGPWYHYSWKGNINKSGGVATNIGVHFFDLLIWLFGDVKENIVHLSKADKVSGYLELENANVSWYLSIDKNDLPKKAVEVGQPTYRSITIDGEEIEFSHGFTDLHTRVYEETINGNGFGIADAKPAIQTVYDIRNSEITSQLDNLHPFNKELIKG